MIPDQYAPARTHLQQVVQAPFTALCFGDRSQTMTADRRSLARAHSSRVVQGLCTTRNFRDVGER